MTTIRGQSIGRYLLLEELGAGAMGIVYAAYDPELDRKIALKLLKHRGGKFSARQRFQREAQALARLDHPSVVRVHDVGVHREDLFIAMEYVDGQTLGGWMAEADLAPTPTGRRLGGDTKLRARPWREVLAVFDQAGRGLAAAHAVGLVHRDFKPENVMLGPDGRARVMDFGLVRFDGGEVDAGSTDDGERASDLTQVGTIMGTPSYMSPEQFLAQEVDARSDQFSFCVALYEALYGERPFVNDPHLESIPMLKAAVLAGMIGEAPRATAVPGWLRAVVLRGLASDPAARFPTMSALLAALADDPVRRRRRSLLRIAVGSGVALIAWGIIALVLALGQREAKIVEQESEIAVKNAALAQRLAAETALLSEQRGLRAMMLIPEDREAEALTLAIQAVGAYAGDWARAPDKALEALEQVLAYDTVVITPDRTLEGHREFLTGVRYSPDGSRLATISLDGTARLWDSAAAGPGETPIAVLEGDQGRLFNLAFSPSGALLVTVGQDPVIRLWDSATGEPLARCEGHTGPVIEALFTADGAALVTASRDGSARIWDPATCELRRILRARGSAPIDALALSADGSRVATAGGALAVIWDFETGAELLTLNGHTATIHALAFSNENTRLATASADASARIWNASTGEEEAVLLGFGGRVSGVAFTPDDSSLVTICWDTIARVFDPETGALRHELRGGHSAGLTDLAFTPEGTRLVTTSFDGSIAVWDLVNGRRMARLIGHSGDVWGVDVAPDGRHVATAGVDRTARIWDLGYPRVAPQDGPERGTQQVVPIPDAPHIATVDRFRQARIWDETSGALLADLGEVEGHGITLSPDGRHLAVVNRQRLSILDRRSGGIRVLPSPGLANGLFYTPDGGRLVARGPQGILWSIDAVSGEPLATIRSDLEAPQIALAPDGTRVAVGGNGRPVTIWDLGEGALVATLDDPRGAADRLAWSADGALLVTASFGAVHLWDPESRAHVATCAGFRGFPGVVEFSRDGAHLGVGSAEGVWLWDRVGCRPSSHYRPEGAIARTGFFRFSGDGSRIVVLHESAARVLNGDTGELLVELEFRSQLFADAHFRANDTRLLTLSEEGLHLWDLATGELVSRERIGVVRAGSAITWPSDPGELLGIACGRLAVHRRTYARVREICDLATTRPGRGTGP